MKENGPIDCVFEKKPSIEYMEGFFGLIFIIYIQYCKPLILKEKDMLKFEEIERFSVRQGDTQFTIQEIGYKPGYMFRIKETTVIVSKEDVIAMREYIANFNPYKQNPPFMCSNKKVILHINWEDTDDILPSNMEFKIGGRWIKIKTNIMLVLSWYLMKI